MEWMLLPYRRLYAAIAGRSSRREYWMFFLLNFIIYVVFIALLMTMGGMANLADPSALGTMMAGAGLLVVIFIIPFYIWALLTAMASFAVTIRRLHDLNLSGWYLLAFYVVFLGLVFALMQVSPSAVLGLGLLFWVLSIVVMAWPGTKGPNKYGGDPTIPNSEAGAEVFA